MLLSPLFLAGYHCLKPIKNDPDDLATSTVVFNCDWIWFKLGAPTGGRFGMHFLFVGFSDQFTQPYAPACQPKSRTTTDKTPEKLVDDCEGVINPKHDALMTQQQKRSCNSVEDVKTVKPPTLAQRSCTIQQFRSLKPPHPAAAVEPNMFTNSACFAPMSANNVIMLATKRVSAMLRGFHNWVVSA